MTGPSGAPWASLYETGSLPGSLPRRPSRLNPRSILGLAALLAILTSLLTADAFGGRVLNARGIPLVLDFVLASFSPLLSADFLRLTAHATLVTAGYAILGTFLSLIFGSVLGLLSSELFWRTVWPGGGRLAAGVSLRERLDPTTTQGAWKLPWVVVRTFLSIPRAIHEVIWGLIFIQVIGLDPLSAVLAIAIPYGAIVAKVYSEILDETPRMPLLSLLASGVRGLPALAYGTLPAALPDLISYGFYRLECSIRAAAVLGIVGAGGLGYELLLSTKSLRYDEMWTLIFALCLLSGLTDLWSALVRRRLSGRYAASRAAKTDAILATTTPRFESLPRALGPLDPVHSSQPAHVAHRSHPSHPALSRQAANPADAVEPVNPAQPSHASQTAHQPTSKAQTSPAPPLINGRDPDERPDPFPPRQKDAWLRSSIALAIAMTWMAFVFLEVDPGQLLEPEVLARGRSVIEGAWPPRLGSEAIGELARLSLQTMAMSVLAMAGAGLIGLIFAFPAAFSWMMPGGILDTGGNRRLRTLLGGSLWAVSRAFLLLLRAVPPFIWALIAVWLLFPGILPGAAALAAYTAGILGRLMAEVVENLDHGPARALKSQGASGLQVAAYGILPQALPRFTAYLLYRWEVCIRATVVVGLVGAGGLGQALRHQIASFDHRGMMATLMAFVLLTIFVDFFSARARRALR